LLPLCEGKIVCRKSQHQPRNFTRGGDPRFPYVLLGERFLNAGVVANGFAWGYMQYDKPGEFTAAEADAREHRRGLWADPHPVPTWEWRREKRQASKSVH
jgi:endonuclease YncB( thermonuclease family)